MRFVLVIVTLFTINFIHLLALRKWGMSEKVDKGDNDVVRETKL